ncbi:MAG TPA: hypothetical protein VMI55_02840 [Thermoplasmata archaeon]|nr:hypothetical protein [Thermoplasmata archaeon]
MSAAASGAGPYDLTLATPGFYLLVATLVLFVIMFLLLRTAYPRRKRAFEGYFDAAGVSLAFLAFSVVLVVALALRDPQGDRTDYALYETILTGYWLAFAIPVVTVASSVQARSRGAIRWILPAIGVVVLVFFAVLGYYYAA